MGSGSHVSKSLSGIYDVLHKINILYGKDKI